MFPDLSEWKQFYGMWIFIQAWLQSQISHIIHTNKCGRLSSSGHRSESRTGNLLVLYHNQAASQGLSNVAI